MISIRVRKAKEGTILAMCDKELLGKTYNEGKAVLDLKKYGSFYEGKVVKEEAKELKNAIKSASIINAVGKKAITILKRAGIKTNGSRTIDGVPHLQVYKI